VRSANAFGVDAVLVLGHGIDPWDPKVIRSSLGAVFHTPLAAVESLEELDAWLGPRREAGMAVVGTDSAGAVPLGEAGLRRPVAVVMGNEARGRSLQERCDRLVAIPLGGQVNSLNVACAASIILHEIGRNSAV
jgi:TrmH family RNA methyltransferase